MAIQEATAGLGVDVGVDVKADLSGLKAAVAELNHALAQAGGALTDATSGVVRLVREAGVDNLVQMLKEGGEEAKQLMSALYSGLHHAAKKGVHEAGEMLAALGRKMEEAGVEAPHTCNCKH